ncbi:MAG: pyridine nucleotide-disulfide oxidoreductase [Gammaproteobacteria bacterium]|nr:MAG: pyridine nucleotide-disulfide oxidoreductase [Gammaproteobacteria bacterium]
MIKKMPRLFLILLIITLISTWFILDLGQFLTLDYFKNQQASIEAWKSKNPLIAVATFAAIYITVAALSLPGAAILTLAGGAIFGLLWGTIIVSFASTIGATLAFLVARILLKDWIQSRFFDKLKTINEGVEKDGAFYLFTLRLVPLFPFFVINLLMGLTPIRTTTFYWVSQAGMLAATLVYVNAGTQLAQVERLQGILSPELLTAFILLGLFPLLAQKTLKLVKQHKIYSKWQKPSAFDNNLIVIGGGSAGLVTAYIGAAVKAKVTLIEKNRMGGDCLNTGCVPSKALIRSAKLLSHIQRASEFGIKKASAEFDFAEVMERVQRVIKTVEPHDSVERYTKLGVDVIQGEARITSPWTVEVTTNGSVKTLTSRNIVIATGARPSVPPIPGLEEAGYLTSDNIWELREQPERLLVLGGGPIGCELSQTFVRLGSKVTQVERSARIMKREDEEVSEMVAQRFRKEGVDLRTLHQAKRIIIENGEKTLICEDLANNNAEVRIGFDQVLVAVGRTANLQGFGLEELDIPVSRTIDTNDYLQTSYPNIYAAGDVAGPYQFTHSAAHQAWYVAVNALFSPFKKFRVDYSVIPWATFVEPEVARVGINEIEALARGIPYEVSRFNIDDLDRAITDEEAHGMIKVLTVPNKDKILGVTIVGEHAGDLIAEYVMAMKQNIGLNKILGTIHIYPTMAEANKYVAGNWKRAHTPEKLLQWVERFHAIRRRTSNKEVVLNASVAATEKK